MRRAARVDNIQNSVVDTLRQLGCSVQVLSAVGHGCPDLLVGHCRKNLLMECKADRGQLTGEQVIWHKGWNGQVAIVRSRNDAITVINNAVRGG